MQLVILGLYMQLPQGSELYRHDDMMKDTIDFKYCSGLKEYLGKELMVETGGSQASKASDELSSE